MPLDTCEAHNSESADCDSAATKLVQFSSSPSPELVPSLEQNQTLPIAILQTWYVLGNNPCCVKRNLLISDRISDAKTHRWGSYLNMTLKEGGRILLVTLSLFSRTLAEKCSDIHFKGIKSSKVRAHFPEHVTLLSEKLKWQCFVYFRSVSWGSDVLFEDIMQTKSNHTR